MNIRFPDSVPAAVQGIPHSVRRANPGVRIIVAIAAIIVALIAARAVYNWLSTEQHIMPPPPVRVGAVTRSNVMAYEQTIGTIVANATVQVTARVDGQLDSAAFTEGQMVHKGDVLFRLDPRPFQAALTQAKATMARDQASLASASNDAKRYSILASMGAASSSQRDQFVAQAKALTATVQADKAAADTAALNLQFSVITSPVDGKTGPILIQPGNLIKANDTNALVTITQIHPVKVSFFLPQSDLPQIQQRMAAGNLTASVQAHNAGQTRESAKVDFVGNAVSATTGTIELRATFPNADGKLVPGQVVDVSVALNRFQNSIVVPHDAVNVGPNGRYVYALESGNAVLVPVNVLYDNGKVAAVQGKLKPGQQVVTDGQLRVIPGKPVTIAGKKGVHGRNAAAGK
ncbi:MAG: efflux RND transporter periplasmic adaptor subunit [Proteobacteria bacterium]|nr:efflux RND transporter periplasmic adaptor subunit [Pseudomonadota bacterium]